MKAFITLILAVLIAACVYYAGKPVAKVIFAPQQTSVKKLVELSPEQLGMLNVGLSLDGLSNNPPRHVRKAIMRKVRKDIMLMSYASRLPSKLPARGE